MKCHACATDNPTDAHFCSDCGVRIVDHPTGSNAAIADLVAAVDDGPTATQPPPEPAHRTMSEHPSTTPPTIGGPVPPATAPPATTPPVATSARPLRRPSALPIIASVAAVLALVGAGAFILFAKGDDDPDAIVTPTDTVTVPSTIAEPSTAVETSAVATAVPAESPPDTTPPTAGPSSTVAASTPPPDPAAVPPPPPEPGPVDAPGSPQVLSNVQPSGPTYVDVRSAFEIAQRFGDALALEDWDLARQLSPELDDTSDADFVQGYASTNRVSLMLRDATPEGRAYRLLVVSVAVENGGAQTSLFCLEWAVDPVAGTVDTRGGSKLVTWDGNLQPEAIRNDPAAMQVVNSCTAP